jgi:hypothetical protein
VAVTWEIFDRLFGLKAEVAVFLTEIKSELVKYFQDELWICRFCDTFDKINNLNQQFQGYSVITSAARPVTFARYNRYSLYTGT